ncbi:WD40 repeat domain-containing protein [Thalassoglobus polymorphus]|uniref:WD domain, G-beta repeat n=1 Tax=Thalassoglobus polymorphus TaxID=2527994 RepID=A0A517QQA4_9PLAN|nr:WD40 repeat domain-containing protein [Thalassoglobus polymorphus]QDT33811.1 WD domain, G-beta repeat [Thalassoglobus polymorphus]
MAGRILFLMLLFFTLLQHGLSAQDKKENQKGTAAAESSPFDPVATGLRAAPIPSTAIRTAAINKNGSLIAFGTGEGKISIWDTKQNKFTHEWSGHDHWVFDLVFDANSERLFSAGGDNKTKIWSSEDWKLLKTFEDHTDDVHSVALTPDETLLITGGDDTNVIVRNLKTGEVTFLKGHTAQVTSTVLSLDGKQAFSASRDQTIRVWDLENLKEIAVFKGHQEDVLHLAIDKSGQHIASASYDGTARLWDVQSLKQIASFEIPKTWVTAVEFSNDSKLLFTGSTDFMVRAFDIQSKKEIWKIATSSDVSDLLSLSDANSLLATSSSHGIYFYEYTNDRAITKQVAIPAYAEWGHASPISTLDYLEMHEALLFEQSSKSWGQKIGLLALYGDAFSRTLIADLKTNELPAPKQELAKRLKDKLSILPQEALGTELIGKYWGRLAVAEFSELRVTETLRDWVTGETRKWSPNPNNFEKELLSVELKVRKELAVLSKSDAEKKRAKEIESAIVMEFRKLADEKNEAK